MLPLARGISLRIVLRGKLDLCRRTFHSKDNPSFAISLAREQSPFNPPLRLQERELKVCNVSQQLSHYAVPAILGLPKLCAPSQGTSETQANSWALPGLAVEWARAFFSSDPDATEYQCTFRLKSCNERLEWHSHGLTYYIELKFYRSKSEHFEVKQRIYCSSTPFSNAKVDENSPCLTEIAFDSWWLSPAGRKTLTLDELISVAASIERKEIDILEPLEAALQRFRGDLKDRKGFRPDRSVDTCIDILEKYQIQQQAWRAHEVHHTVIDGSRNRYVVRTPAHYLSQQYLSNSSLHRAVVALGSNIGDRTANIEQSLKAMKRRGVEVRSTSFLYETEAMYYKDQDSFLNGVCEVEVSMEPLDLLDTLQQIEAELGRVKLIDKGPRSIDLDILLYDYSTFEHPRLQIPHKLMLEREFVLRPLADIIPGERLPPPCRKLSVAAYLEHLVATRTGTPPSVASTLGSRLPFARPEDPSRTTRIMAILNVTPDSFSDGGRHHAGQLDAVEAEVKRFIAGEASIIDVGGQSTRPGATRICWQEELGRVLPVIKRIRSMPEARNIAISIDTFYADVARSAIAAGADIVNDVSGGMLDSQMLPLIADLQATIVLMHMRGTPETMKKLTNYPDGVVEGVAKELLDRVGDALRAGIPRWRIVLDPGIGFAKTQAQNLELLCNLNTLRQYPGLRHFPWLVGTSRKGFIGRITGVSSAAERSWGTAATVTASVAGGADIVRVHDVSEMVQVTKMADAMYRFEPRPHTGNATAEMSKALGDIGSAEGHSDSIPRSHSVEDERDGLFLSQEFYDAFEEASRE